MPFSTIFFDLDDTLYDTNCGLWPAIRDRIGRFMTEVMGLPEAEAQAMRNDYYQHYGTTLRGLQVHHNLEPSDYLAYVHDLPLDQYLTPDPDLRPFLLSLPQRRFIFTNADAAHAERVLARLEISDCFDGIIDIRALDFDCKPHEGAYRRALVIAGDPDPRVCLMIDDSIANLTPAHALGLTTVRVHPQVQPHPAADYSLETLLALRQALPQLWNGANTEAA